MESNFIAYQVDASMNLRRTEWAGKTRTKSLRKWFDFDKICLYRWIMFMFNEWSCNNFKQRSKMFRYRNTIVSKCNCQKAEFATINIHPQIEKWKAFILIDSIIVFRSKVIYLCLLKLFFVSRRIWCAYRIVCCATESRFNLCCVQIHFEAIGMISRHLAISTTVLCGS